MGSFWCRPEMACNDVHGPLCPFTVNATRTVIYIVQCTEYFIMQAYELADFWDIVTA